MDRTQLGLKQPFLICQGSEELPLTFHLVIEDNIIYCGPDTSQAFKNLFASFYVFRLEYPPLLSPFYRFFEECVFKISPPKASNIDYVRMLSDS